MIVYDLRCENNHPFEGWFKSRDDYLAQCDQQLITCPFCHSTSIRRCPSAPNMMKSRTDAEVDSQEAGLSELYQTTGRLYHQLIESMEDAGTNLAEEVRKVHYRETHRRSLRGVATPEEVEALSEEGIDLIPIPIPIPEIYNNETH